MNKIMLAFVFASFTMAFSFAQNTVQQTPATANQNNQTDTKKAQDQAPAQFTPTAARLATGLQINTPAASAPQPGAKQEVQTIKGAPQVDKPVTLDRQGPIPSVAPDNVQPK